jgi:prephenate dehydrogenase
MGITVAIVGVGLIGGSFGLALRKAGVAERVLGVSSPATLAKATGLGIVDAGLPLVEAMAEADLVFLSATIRSIINTLPALSETLKPGALVTDAGSTKRAIMQAAGQVPGMRFVGGHPMAGKERSGVEQADSELFAGRQWVLCAGADGQPKSLEQLREIVSAVGAQPVEMTAEAHDALVARTSHLPQLLSTALAATLDHRLDSARPMLAGPGLLDATRLAQSPFHVWRDILETNSDEIAAAMEEFQQQWQRQRVSLGVDAALETDFQRACGFASRLRQQQE